MQMAHTVLTAVWTYRPTSELAYRVLLGILGCISKEDIGFGKLSIRGVGIVVGHLDCGVCLGRRKKYGSWWGQDFFFGVGGPLRGATRDVPRS